MAADLELDPDLLDEVLSLSGETTVNGAVALALREFVERRAQVALTEFFGLLQWDDQVDLKAARRSS